MLCRITLVAMVAAAATTAGCFKAAEFACTSDIDCTRSGVQGACEPVGYCSFPDPDCDDGRRYADYSGAYSGTCVINLDPVPVIIGGTVSGLLGRGLVLRNNGADDLAITADGAFAFLTPVFTGFPYAVVVGAQPTTPTQTCTIANGVDLAGREDVTTVEVTCATAAYPVGGTVTGLVGTGLVLTNNGGNAKAITADGTFEFSMPVASSGPFAVAIQTQPVGQTCNVSGATGTVGVGTVTSVVVNCTPSTYTIGGTVTGLTGTVVVRNNGGDDRPLNANGTFAFPTPQGPATPYSVAVVTQPVYPPQSQTCTVTMGSGAVAAANVTSVAITCVTNTFTIGGTVSGLTGTLVLRNNGGDDKSITANGAYTFATPIASGMTYAVTRFTNPTNQACTISGGSGTVGGASITNANATCVTAGVDPGIKCSATTFCNPTTQFCCFDPALGQGTCQAIGTSCSKTDLPCDSRADCGGTNVCCARTSQSSGNLQAVTCEASEAVCLAGPGMNDYNLWCYPSAATPCPAGKTCTGSTGFPGYFKCQ